jgi:hypothetical protein
MPVGPGPRLRTFEVELTLSGLGLAQIRGGRSVSLRTATELSLQGTRPVLEIQQSRLAGRRAQFLPSETVGAVPAEPRCYCTTMHKGSGTPRMLRLCQPLSLGVLL